MNTEKCPLCNGSYWLLKQDPAGVMRAIRCQCYENVQIQDLIEHARIPKHFRDKRLENFIIEGDQRGKAAQNAKEAKQICKDFIEKFPSVERGILFMGPSGAGKTHLAVSILLDLIQTSKVFCLFCDYASLITELKSSYDEHADLPTSEILQPITNVELLLLDDLGSVRIKDWILDTLTYIINTRYNNDLITIITTKFQDPPERKSRTKQMETAIYLEELVGRSIRSRLYEMCQEVKLDLLDYRQAKSTMRCRRSTDSA